MPNVPIIQQGVAPETTKVSDASLQIAYSEGMEDLNNRKYQQALQTFQNILLDNPADKIPMEVYLALARTYRLLKAPDRSVVTLLPLLKSQSLAISDLKTKQKFMFELGISDALLHNDAGTVHFLIPVFPLLEKPSEILSASTALMSYFEKNDPLEGTVLLGHAIDRLDPVSQKKVLSLTIDLIHDHLHQPQDLQSVENTFPHEFPGDYALFRMGLIEVEQNQPDQAERTFLKILSNYPSSLFSSAVQERLNHLSFPEGSPKVVMILPFLSDRVRGGFARSILTGIDLFMVRPAGTSEPATPFPLIVRFSRNGPAYRATFRTLEKHFRILALVGPFFSDDLNAVQKMLEDRKFLSITPTLPPRKNLTVLYSTATLPEMMAAAAAIGTSKRVPSPTAVILYPSGPYGKMAADTYERVLGSLGGKLLSSFSYRSDRPDHQTSLDTLRKMGKVLMIGGDAPLPPGLTRVSADIMTQDGKTYFLNTAMSAGKQVHSLFLPSFNTVYIPDTSMHPAAILRELAYKNIQNITVFGNETFLTTKGLSGIEDLHDAVYATGVSPGNGPHATGISNKKRKSASLFALQTFDALSILEKALSQGANDNNAVLEQIKSHPVFLGASGTITWDGPGKYRKTIGIFRLTRNRWIPSDTVEVTYPVNPSR
ncbi:MAG: tetratricopeptide repeat protein [Leptospirales bacterium]